MKILIVMGGFFPGQKYGGPPVSVDIFCSLLKDEVESLNADTKAMGKGHLNPLMSFGM